MNRLVLVLLVVFLNFQALSFVILDIEVTHEKGLDEKTILKSEFMSKEIIESEKLVTLGAAQLPRKSENCARG